jgi:hypothetical protein
MLSMLTSQPLAYQRGSETVEGTLQMRNHVASWGARLFLDRKFAHYTWIGVFISLLNIALLYLAIDVLGFTAIVSSPVIIGGTFVLRYVMFDLFNVLR